ncbi:MAG: glycoside hydrolase catalytic domain [Paenibacillaceae bacterium]|nr:glycoside hydrolase catalytic domain [Paenibacillaceae bacterium]
MREVINFDFDWKCKLAGSEKALSFPDETKPEYSMCKTNGAVAGPASVQYQAAGRDWSAVTLPHDYVITETPSKENSAARGYLKVQEAWYRKLFLLEAADRNKRITLYFEGIMGHSRIYVNGCLLHRNFSGYLSFEVDITDYANFDKENVVAVFVDPTEPEGWWYDGGGMYRHVRLIKTELQSVDLWGVYACPAKKEETWDVSVETTVRNDDSIEQEVQIKNEILDGMGRTAAEWNQSASVQPKNKSILRDTVPVRNPRLWSVNRTNMYTLRTTVLRDGVEMDQVLTPFGFRTIRFDADGGFFLNEEQLEIKGVCCHQDYGLTGKAMPDRVQRYRMKLLKEMGANGYRAAHYMTAEETMNAADELGFLVMCETRGFHSSPEGISQLEALIKRDRNHPSVILWSIGNEEPLHAQEQGKRIAERMVAAAAALDRSRCITAAVCHKPVDAPVNEGMQVIGLNYNLDCLDELRAKHPQTPILISECCASSSTRGWYLDDCRDKGYYSAYDHLSGVSLGTREATYQIVSERKWIAGTFQWAGIEHRGETAWPRLCSQSGALDLFLQKKDAFYQMQSFWTGTPMIHLLPHWNLPGREGEPVSVWAYTNCEEAELFVNGKSYGTKQARPYTHLEWTVPYEPGTLQAVARTGGAEAARDEAVTAGEAAVLHVRLEDENIAADGQDVAIITCFCTDSKGHIVPDASPAVTFSINRYGTLLGTGSDVCDHVPVNSYTRQMRAGLVSAVVRTTKEKGILRVLAQAPGLQPARLDIALR